MAKSNRIAAEKQRSNNSSPILDLMHGFERFLRKEISSLQIQKMVKSER
jgi:hypothetical protein